MQEALLTCDSCGRSVDVMKGDADGWITLGTVKALEQHRVENHVHGEVCSLTCLRIRAATLPEPRVVEEDPKVAAMRKLGMLRDAPHTMTPERVPAGEANTGQYL